MKRSTKIRIRHRGAPMLFYLPRCRCPARPTITPPGSSAPTAGRSARAGASSTRPAGPAGPAYLRKGETFAELAAGFGIGTATAWRYVAETVALLAAHAPKLRQALRDARKAGRGYLVIDGTLIPVDRVAADRPFYSDKHRKHGMNLQVIASPDGDIVWVSGPLPGAVHDLTGARIGGIVRELAASGPGRAGRQGLRRRGAHPHSLRGRNKPASQKEANRAHARLRAPGERAHAQLRSLAHPAQAPLLPLPRQTAR
jgi:hypothetical protein